MQKNVASQKWVVFAFDRTDNTPKTGDAANITANLRIDGGGANAVDDTNPTELEDGFYVFDLTAAETNGDYILISPASSTSDIQVIGCPAAVFTTPANFQALGIESDGDVTKVNTLDGHTAQTGDSYSIVNGDHGLVSIQDDVDAILADTNELQGNQSNWATATGFSTHSAADVWSVATRAITDKAGFTISGTKTTLDALNDVSAADVNAQCDTALTDYGANTTTPPTAAAIRAEMDSNSTKLADILTDTGTTLEGHLTDIKGATFSGATDSLEAIRNRGDAEWITADVSSLATSAQVTTVDGKIDTIDGVVDAILVDTNELQTNQGNWLTAEGFSTHSAADVKTAIEQAGSSIAQILEDTGTTLPASIAALNDISVADIIAGIADGTYDLQEMLRIMFAALAGKSAGGGTGTITYRDAADAKNRISATVDSNNDRTAIALDGA